MNNSEAYMRSIANTFTKEPVFNCPKCNAELHTDWVDNGFGPYSVQASPYGCECGWWETGCKECIKEKCFSWGSCQGRALVNQLAESPAHHTMSDPNVKAEEVKDDAAAIAPAEQATETNQEAPQASEEGAGALVD